MANSVKNSPIENEPGSFLLDSNSPFLIKEAYKALRTNIVFSLPGEGSKIIAFTSDTREAGKSTNAVNTAISFAEIGKKVLLIDCDMRLPTVAKRFKINTIPGLSDMLVMQARPSEVVHQIGPNLSVIPAGRIPKDPTKLLEAEVTARLFQRLRETYDYVIVDLPPINTVADASIISKYVDGFIFVVRHENSEFKSVSEGLRLLKLADAKVLGFLYNDAPLDGKKSYHYKYYG